MTDMTKGAMSPLVVAVRAKCARLPDRLPPITLRHGQALWLLTELGYRGPVSRSAFYEYIKSLR